MFSIIIVKIYTNEFRLKLSKDKCGQQKKKKAVKEKLNKAKP